MFWYKFLYENEKLGLLVILKLYPATRWGNQFRISNLLLSVLCSHFVNSIKVIRRAICLSRSTILISYASFWCSSSNTLFTHTYMQNNLYFHILQLERIDQNLWKMSKSMNRKRMENEWSIFSELKFNFFQVISQKIKEVLNREFIMRLSLFYVFYTFILL